MSRADRERWAMSAEQWPHLQAFLSERLAKNLFGESGSLADKIESEINILDFERKMEIATDCWKFLGAFKGRHDDRQFIQHGFGVHGWVVNDDRGRGQMGLDRIKLVYDGLAASIRRREPNWRPAR